MEKSIPDPAAANPSSSSPSKYFSCVICSADTEELGPIINFCGHVFCWPCLYDCVTVNGTRRLLRGRCPICHCGIDLCPRTQTVCPIYYIGGPDRNYAFGCVAARNIDGSSREKSEDKLFIDKPLDKRFRPGNSISNAISEVVAAHILYEHRLRSFLSNWRSTESQLNNIVQEIQRNTDNLREKWQHIGGAPVHDFYNEITELVDELRSEIMRCQNEVFDTILEVRQIIFDLHTGLKSHHPNRGKLSSSIPGLIAQFREEDRTATTEEKSFEIRKCDSSQEVQLKSFLPKTKSPSLSPSHLSCTVCNTSTLNEHVHSVRCDPIDESTNPDDEHCSLCGSCPFCKVKATVSFSNTDKLIAGEESSSQGQQNLKHESSIKISPNEVLDSMREDISRTMDQIEALMNDFKSLMDNNRWNLHSIGDFIEDKTWRLLTGLEDGWLHLTSPIISKGVLKAGTVDKWINDPPRCWFEVLDVDAALK